MSRKGDATPGAAGARILGTGANDEGVRRGAPLPPPRTRRTQAGARRGRPPTGGAARSVRGDRPREKQARPSLTESGGATVG